MSTRARLSSILPLALAFVAMTVPAHGQQSMVSGTALTIDRECASLQKAATPPVHLLAKTGKWSVATPADLSAAMQQKSSVSFADASKAADRYVWVTIDAYSASGVEQAVQLCFRQSDGTLQRARQASTVAELDGPAVQEGYYASNGKMIYANSAFHAGDPLLYKTLESLPFYDVLPK